MNHSENLNLVKDFPKSFEQVIADMHTCDQTQGLSVYQHGQAVKDRFTCLLETLKAKVSDNWKLPTFLFDHADWFLSNLHDLKQIESYTLFHDCGKPYCLVIDDIGKRHFPNHQEVSGAVWDAFKENKLVGKLIRNDMFFHTCTSDDLTVKLQEWDVKDLVTLFLVAISEIHANASMFGGLDSVSFKIKYKQLERRGNQLFKHFL